MNILVTGANGQLGRSLAKATAASAHNYIFTDIDTLDITSPESVAGMLDGKGIDIVVNCAAYTDVNKAESDADAARLINAEAPAILAAAIAKRGGFLIHVSTDYVFGGDSNIPLKEDDPLSPLGVYGKTKAEGERKIREITPHHIIIRTAWLYSEYGRNFVKTMLTLTGTHDEVKVVADQTGSPTYALDLAEAIACIIESGAYSANPGTYHFTDLGTCTWFDLAHEVSSIARHKARVVPCSTDEFPSPAPRPAFSVLDKRKISDTFGLQIPYWRDSLVKCLENILSPDF